MTRTEAFEKAWRLGADKKDFSLVDEIYHPDYKAVDVMTGVEVNLEDDKAQIIALNEEVTVGPYKTLSETEDFLQVQACVRINKEVFFKNTTSITYKDGKIITQKSETEDLNDDPSEGQDWSWEDYE